MKIARLQATIESLIEAGFILETRPIVSRPVGREVEIEIGETSAVVYEGPLTEGCGNYYLEIVKQNKLSFILFDGAIIQILYRIRGKRITFHRYCFIPAPFDGDLRQVQDDDYFTSLEGEAIKNPLDAPRRSILRFEFDPNSASHDHPAAHLHLGIPECRIPMWGPIAPDNFLLFLTNFFYGTKIRKDILATRFDQDKSITLDEQIGFHFGWIHTM